MNDALYVVVTNYTKPDGRTIMHTYGPHDAAKARRVHNQMIKETTVPEGGKLRIHTCKLINIESL